MPPAAHLQQQPWHTNPHASQDPNSGKGPGGEPLPNINLAYHCDSTFAQLGDPQFPTSGLLKVRGDALCL